MAVRIAMVAGESSGDLLAAHLIAALRLEIPDAEFYGIGGPKMEALGFRSLYSYERLAVNGFIDALKRYRELAAVRRRLLQQLVDDRVDAFIGVDAPDFNLWLEARIRGHGIPAIHFVSPSIWAWRGGRIKQIAQAVSHMLCLFPFEPAIYQAAGVAASFVGHPLADSFPLHPDRLGARKALHLSPDGRMVALLPGSRQSEVGALARSFIGAAALLVQRHPEIQFLVPLATQETRKLFEQAVLDAKATSLPVRLFFGHSAAAMTAADVVLVASGTASLEAALLKRPMVICYRMGFWQFRLLKRFYYLPWVGLPNILLGEQLVPELLQDEATPQAMADAVDSWLHNPDACERLYARFTALHLSLRQNMSQKAAQAILPYLCPSLAKETTRGEDK